MRNKQPAPVLMHVEDDPKVQEMRATLAHYEHESRDAHSALAEMDRQVAFIETQLAATEVRVLAGRATDSDLAAVQAQLLEAKRAQAIQFHRADDADRLVKLMPSAIETALQEARTVVAANLRAAYGPAVARLRDLLLAAAQAHEEVERLFEHAMGEFSPPMHPRYHSFVADLGDAGLTSQAAGLPRLSMPLFERFRNGADGSSPLGAWMREADALLAELPGMAQRDAEHRGRSEDSLARAAREEERKLANLAEIERKYVQKFALAPFEPVPPTRSGSSGE